MNHRPFEDWLFADQPLTAEQKRELQSHLHTCAACTAIAEVNLALRSARTAVPAPGFSSRWQARLAAERKLQQRRLLTGTAILGLGGAALFAWVTAPLVGAFAASPAEWIVQGINYLLFLMTSLRAVGEAAEVLARVAPGFVPAYFWLVLFSALSGFSLLGSISLWRVARLPQKA